MMQRVALYGGSFNPIHVGHLISARAIAEHLGLDRVIFLPSARPPHKPASEALDSMHRAEMVKLAIEGEPGFEFSDYDLTRSGPTYTIDTVRHFSNLLGAQTTLYWIIGADSLPELGTWHRIHELLDSCTMITAMRPGIPVPDVQSLRSALGDERLARLLSGRVCTPAIEISSTDIRDRVRRGRSVRYSVPHSVLEYIHRHGLYRAPHSEPR